MGNVIDAENSFEIASLRKKIKDLEVERTKIMILLSELSTSADPNSVSDVEAICVAELSKLKQLSDNSGLTSEDVKNLDILHKNLKIARGENTRVGAQSKAARMSSADLEKIAKEV